jgi:hypothetical protein
VVLIVDAANVVGSRPNGWWRDRAGAAKNLCEQLAKSIETGELAAPVTVVLEGAARSGVPEGEQSGLGVVHAPRSGDDTIVSLANDATSAGQDVTVVTADRELRDRLKQISSDVVGPRWLLDHL